MTSATSIRIASDRDNALLTRLIRTSFQDVAQRFGLTTANCPKHPSNCTERWIREDAKRGVRYFVLASKWLPCGCVAMEKAPDGTCYLERLAVLPEKRKRGFGGQLVHHVIRQARKIEVTTISVGIIKKQTELIAWYEALGFVKGECKHLPHLPFTVAFMSYSL